MYIYLKFYFWKDYEDTYKCSLKIYNLTGSSFINTRLFAEPSQNVSVNVNGNAGRLFSVRCQEAAVKCDQLQDDDGSGHDLSYLLGRSFQHALSSRTGSHPQPPLSRLSHNISENEIKRDSINFDIRSIFESGPVTPSDLSSESGQLPHSEQRENNRRRLGKEMSLRTRNRQNKPVFKHTL